MSYTQTAERYARGATPMTPRPGDIAHFCNFLEYRPGDRIGPDLMTFEVRRDLPDTSKTSAIPHNALEDARALARGVLAAA